MDGFKNVEISNFRGIDHLKIEDFSRVNIFLGQIGFLVLNQEDHKVYNFLFVVDYFRFKIMFGFIYVNIYI